MIKNSNATQLQILELQLEEAVQMLRLAADNKRTCLEIKEWLDQNFPEENNNNNVMNTLLNTTSSKKADK